MWQSSDPIRRKALWYVLASIFCAVFACVYEYFSHGVWSYFMVFAFLYPLIGGALPCLAFGQDKLAGIGFWQAGLAALTMGSLFQGALEIYGTSHPLVICYFIIGDALCLFGAVQFLFDVRRVSRYNNIRKTSYKEEITDENHYHQP